MNDIPQPTDPDETPYYHGTEEIDGTIYHVWSSLPPDD